MPRAGSPRPTTSPIAAKLPVPRSPTELSPKQRTAPDADSAHTCLVPTATSTIDPATVVTRSGASTSDVSLPPSCPLPFPPQQYRSPEPTIAQAFAPNANTRRAFVRPGTYLGAP